MNHAGLKIDPETFFKFETLGAPVLLETSKLGDFHPSTEQLTPQLGPRILPGPPELGSGVRWKQLWGFEDTFLLACPTWLSAPSSS